MVTFYGNSVKTNDPIRIPLGQVQQEAEYNESKRNPIIDEYQNDIRKNAAKNGNSAVGGSRRARRASAHINMNSRDRMKQERYNSKTNNN